MKKQSWPMSMATPAATAAPPPILAAAIFSGCYFSRWYWEFLKSWKSSGFHAKIISDSFQREFDLVEVISTQFDAF